MVGESSFQTENYYANLVKVGHMYNLKQCGKVIKAQAKTLGWIQISIA